MLDTLYDDLDPRFWGTPPPPTPRERARLSQLVFLDGRLVDAWSEDVRDTRYAALARELDEERRPRVQLPPPRHEQVLGWLDDLTGGRDALHALTAVAPETPPLRDLLDPVADEPWLVVDELLGDLMETHLAADLAGPLRQCLCLLHAADRHLVDRSTPARVAGGVVWVVGKANGELGPSGPVRQKDVARALGVSALDGQSVLGRVRRLTWTTGRPWQVPDLLPTGRSELLGPRVRSDLVRLRDDALAERASEPGLLRPPEA